MRASPWVPFSNLHSVREFEISQMGLVPRIRADSTSVTRWREITSSSLSPMLISVPNYSEGRDPGRIAGLRAVLAERLEVLDRHSDHDHHRTVFTVAGEPNDLVRSLADSAGA